MWLTHDSAWPGSNHVLVITGCVCCTLPAHCLIAQDYVILPVFYDIFCHITCCMSFLDFWFPTFGRPPLVNWCFCDGAYWPWLEGLGHFPCYCLCKNVLQLPQCLFDLLSQVFFWGYGGAAYVLKAPCDECQSSSPVWCRNVPLGSSLLGLTITPCVHGLPLSCWTATVAPSVKTEGSFQVYLSLLYFHWGASNASKHILLLVVLIGSLHYK